MHQAEQQLPEAVLLATLSNELEKLPGEAILILDDHHSIRSAKVQTLLCEVDQYSVYMKIKKGDSLCEDEE